jgi:hypothetical protein
VRYYGCPAEEGGAAKTFMVRAGAFEDVDVAITWHPHAICDVAKADSLANARIDFTFKGKASHASASPHLGRSALDAVELMNVGVNYLREHMPSDARVHYAYLDAGGVAPNVVQATARVRYLIRAGALAGATRRFVKENGHSILIEDNIRLNDSTKSITWQLITAADVEITKGGAILRQDGKQLKLGNLSHPNVMVSIISLDPPPLELDRRIENLKRIEIRLPAYLFPEGHGAVRVVPVRAAAKEAMPVVRVLGRWPEAPAQVAVPDREGAERAQQPRLPAILEQLLLGHVVDRPPDQRPDHEGVEEGAVVGGEDHRPRVRHVLAANTRQPEVQVEERLQHGARDPVDDGIGPLLARARVKLGRGHDYGHNPAPVTPLQLTAPCPSIAPPWICVGLAVIA